MHLAPPDDDTEATAWSRGRALDLHPSGPDGGDEEADGPDDRAASTDTDTDTDTDTETDPDTSTIDGDRLSLPVALDSDALAALVRRVMDQDQAALAALYDALSGRVYACALRVTRQVAVAEEVMQDTFWQIWRQAPRFDPQRGSAQTWVLNMARSRALDAMRSLQRDRLHTQDAEYAEIEDPHSNPQDLLDGLQRDARLQHTLARLDPLKRQLIALAFYRGLTQDEIAQQTGMPLGTVKSHLRRTLAVLREALGTDPCIHPQQPVV
jgi:RNA polymerase sigma factor (sigma-70 family)